MIHGIFHGDLHGGNLFVLPDGRTALLDFGIIGRLSDDRRRGVPAPDGRRDHERPRRARWPPCATSARCRPTPTSTRSSTTSASTSRRSTRPRSPATRWPKEVQRVVKALLGYGARMPKELMLYVKNMVFLDGAIARLAPDLDLFAEIASISMYFAAAPRRADRPRPRHRPDAGEHRPRRRQGRRSASTPASSRLTYRELQARRALIQQRMRDDRPDRADAERRTSAPAAGARVGGGTVARRARR